MNYNLLSGQKTSLKTSLKIGERMSPKTRTGQKTDQQTDWNTKQRMSHNISKQRHQKRHSLLVVNVIHKVTDGDKTCSIPERPTTLTRAKPRRSNSPQHNMPLLCHQPKCMLRRAPTVQMLFCILIRPVCDEARSSLPKKNSERSW
jgi:hypothetical protein